MAAEAGSEEIPNQGDSKVPTDQRAEPDILGEAIAALIRSNPEPFFVQVGGFDGESFDPLRPHIVEKNLTGLIVEPIPQYFDKLKALYAGSKRIVPVNCAIGEQDGERTIWRFNPTAVERGLLPPHFAGISSFLMEDLLKETGVLGRSSPNPETTAALRSLVQAVQVRCRTMEGLLREHGVRQVDILQIDTEGYDFIILKLFDFTHRKPAIVHYEHQHLNADDRAAAEALLRSHGYQLQRKQYDTLAVHAGSAAASKTDVGALRDLASALDKEGRANDALLILQHLSAVRPHDGETLRRLSRLLASQGRTLDALDELSKFKAVATDVQNLVDEIKAQMPAAMDQFNAHAAAGRIAEAERYAAALASLVPGNVALLNSAFSCNVALQRRQQAERYATAILALEPNHFGARALLANAPQPVVETERKTADDAHPLIRLRDVHDAISHILCGPLTDNGVERIGELLRASQALKVDVPADSDWAGWEKHYRLALMACDPAAAVGPTPELPETSNIEIASSSGKRLDWAAVQARSKKLGAKVAFFAAGDRGYVDLYARWYIKSILKYADVPCLVVVHVIGGAGQLGDVAKSLGIEDDRVIFCGDDFDAANVRTKCFDTPPKGLIQKPVAHFQSVRFLRLGDLLQKLRLPVFVSDIDLLLQRGVDELLHRCGDVDLVLNENTANAHAGSRFTANLLLVHPTANAQIFLRCLRGYLEAALSGAEVSRWIDQFGLMMAQHHLTRRGVAPRIGRFDTTKDINNVMYKSYQDNPFTFLSLYHGFDTSTLDDGDAAPQAKAAGRSRKKQGKRAAAR